MLYRIAQAVNSSYGLAVAWTYIGAFLLAFCMLFIFPQVTLLLLFLGLASLALTISLGWAIDATTRALARRSLRRDTCPRCGSNSLAHIALDHEWTCEHCHSQFQIGGREIDEQEQARFVATDDGDEFDGIVADARFSVDRWRDME